MKKVLTGFTLAIGLGIQVFAQGFLTPVSQIPPKNEAYVVLFDGSRIEGTVKAYSMTNDILKSVNFEDSQGNKHKWKAAEMKELVIKTNAFSKMDMISENSESIRKMVKADFSQVAKREYIVYEQALLPGKGHKYGLLQLLNPGFDSRVKVYQDPSARETQGVSTNGIRLSGGIDRSYLVVKDGTRADMIRKGAYKQQFLELFGDCGEMLTAFGGEKTKFRDFADHVFVYDQLCLTAESNHN
jgi:hypothetical protein